MALASKFPTAAAKFKVGDYIMPLLLALGLARSIGSGSMQLIGSGSENKLSLSSGEKKIALQGDNRRGCGRF
jgi:hypothetical protein